MKSDSYYHEINRDNINIIDNYIYGKRIKN